MSKDKIPDHLMKHVNSDHKLNEKKEVVSNKKKEDIKFEEFSTDKIGNNIDDYIKNVTNKAQEKLQGSRKNTQNKEIQNDKQVSNKNIDLKEAVKDKSNYIKNPSPTTNLTLDKLKNSLGIPTSPFSKKIAGYTWDIKVLSSTEMAALLDILNDNMLLYMNMQDISNIFLQKIAILSLAVVSIDKQPIYKIFKVKVPKINDDGDYTEVPASELISGLSGEMPFKVRKAQAESLYNFFAKECRSFIIDELYDFYESISQPDETEENVFKCEACGSVEMEDKDTVSLYCKYDGELMTKISNTSGDSSPLS